MEFRSLHIVESYDYNHDTNGIVFNSLFAIMLNELNLDDLHCCWDFQHVTIINR